MSELKKDKFWNKRAKGGRKKVFSNADELRKACEEYFQYTDKRKLYKLEYRGVDLIEVKTPLPVPYTISGLCVFLDIHYNTWQNYKKNESHKVFHDVIAQVEDIIYTQKYEGAVTGVFNTTLVGRDLGLAEKKDTKSETPSVLNINKIVSNFLK